MSCYFDKLLAYYEKTNDQEMQNAVKNKIKKLAVVDQKQDKEQEQEQEQEYKKIAIVAGHRGTGDQLTMFCAIKFLSIIYDLVIVVAVAKDYDLLTRLYLNDDPFGIQIYYVSKENQDKYDDISSQLQGLVLSDCTLLTTGVYNKNWENRKMPFFKQFYYDLKIPDFTLLRDLCPLCPFNQMKINHYDDVNDNKYLNQTFKNKYIFMHEDLIRPIKIKHLIKNPNNFEIIAANANIELFDHINLMENATELHLLDSCFFCLASYLNLDNVSKCVCYVRKSTLSALNGRLDWLKQYQRTHHINKWIYIFI